MRWILFASIFIPVIFLAAPRMAFSAEDDLSGFTLRQLEAAVTKGGLATQKIYSILTFDSDEQRGAEIAILAGSRSSWRVTVLRRVEGGLKVEWQSGDLPGDMDVSSSNSLEIKRMDDGEQVVEFSGCARHLCGGADGVFGVLLYSTRSGQAFFAHYRFDEGKPKGASGSLNFSENASEPDNAVYKAALKKMVNQILGQ